MNVKELVTILNRTKRDNAKVTIWVNGIVYEIDSVDMFLERGVELNVKEIK